MEIDKTRTYLPLSEAKEPFFAGVDLGGTNIKIGVVDDEGREIAYLSVPTYREQGPEQGAQRMGQGVNECIRQAGIDKKDLKRFGLVTPGTMDIPSGMLLEPHNLPGWFQFPIRDKVAEYAGLPVTYANDAGAAAYGEYWRGSGKNFHSMILLTLGTGVGGGIIIGDTYIEGEHSCGAECGHIIIDSGPNARLCRSGGVGNLEAYASATALIDRTQEALDAGRESSLGDRRDKGEEITPLMVAEEAERGDELSLELVMDTATYLGIGITTLIHVIDPNGVVLGGAMTFGGNESELGRKFLAHIKQEVNKRALPPASKDLVLDFALLGGDAGFIGAAGLSRLEYRQEQLK